MNAHFGNRTLKALWIGRDLSLAGRIGSAIKDLVVSYDQRTPELLEGGERLAAPADVIFMEVGGADDAGRFETLAAQRSPDQRIVAVTTGSDYPVLRRLVRSGGLSDWLMADAAAEDILAACNAPRTNTAAQGPRNVIIFSPVLGGMGATTLAIEAAIQLSKNGKEPSCLVDLDLYSGECADFLNLEAKLAIDSLAKNSDGVDEHLLEGVLTPHASGISLLAAKTQLGSQQTINPNTVLHLLNLVSSSFTHVVIDLPRTWQPWTDDILLGSDAVFLVADGSVPALKAARRQLDEFHNRYGGKVKPMIIVNKHDRAWFSTSIREKDLRNSLGEAFAGTIMDETKIAREAIDRGVPISTIKRNATVVKDLHAIIKKHSR